jgi:hypothetical protein
MRIPPWSALAVIAAAPLGAQDTPSPPCNRAAVPAFASLGEEPAVQHWTPSDVPPSWSLPPCVPNGATPFASLVTVAGRFRHDTGVDGLLRRIGAVSSLAGIRYWSAGRGKWRTFVENAYALTAKDGRKREDFSRDELIAGDSLYYVQHDNTAGNVVYRMRITTASENRVVLHIENASTVRFLVFTGLHPGDMQATYFFHRESDDVWTLYGMLRMGTRAHKRAVGKPASSINRAVAFYRHLAGIPTDKDPPAARRE